MIERKVDHLMPGCPWYELSEKLPPTIQWCERNHCAWIVNPVNTWTNLIYIILAFHFYFIFKIENRYQKKIAIHLFFVGLTSFIHHAAYNFVTQWFDFVGMFAFLIFIFTINLRRLEWIKPEKILTAWLIGTLSFSVLAVVAYFVAIPLQISIPIIGLGILLTELKINSMKTSLYRADSMKNFYIALFMICFAEVFSILDFKRILCEPDSLIQGHGIWHLLGGVALYFLTLHMIKIKRL
jgi:hypothetical protein